MQFFGETGHPMFVVQEPGGAGDAALVGVQCVDDWTVSCSGHTEKKALHLYRIGHQHY